MRYMMLIALLLMACGDDDLKKDPYVAPEEPYQANERECRVCVDENNYYNPPVRFDCGPTASQSCVAWCNEVNCRMWARSNE